MKFLRNLLIATTAVAAMSATAAFADATATYTDGTVAVTGVDTTVFGDQVTVVIVPNTVGGTVEEGEIYYINQADKDGIADILAGMGMKELTDTDGTDYEVWIGGSDVSETNPIIKLDFKTVVDSIKYGDVDGQAGITTSDASVVAEIAVGKIIPTADVEKAADVDGQTGVTTSDASVVAEYAVGKITSFPVEATN